MWTRFILWNIWNSTSLVDIVNTSLFIYLILVCFSSRAVKMWKIYNEFPWPATFRERYSNIRTWDKVLVIYANTFPTPL